MPIRTNLIIEGPNQQSEWTEPKFTTGPSKGKSSITVQASPNVPVRLTRVDGRQKIQVGNTFVTYRESGTNESENTKRIRVTTAAASLIVNETMRSGGKIIHCNDEELERASRGGLLTDALLDGLP